MHKLTGDNKIALLRNIMDAYLSIVYKQVNDYWPKMIFSMLLKKLPEFIAADMPAIICKSIDLVSCLPCQSFALLLFVISLCVLCVSGRSYGQLVERCPAVGISV